MSERKPLTLEELRCMANKPYWHVGLRENSGAPHWSILDPLLAYHPEDYDYGKTWLAYAADPPRLDRSEWTAEWIWPSNEFNLPKCSKCGCNSQDATYGHKNNFCPKCGRAMNADAWEMLEKRLEGARK